MGPGRGMVMGPGGPMMMGGPMGPRPGFPGARAALLAAAHVCGLPAGEAAAASIAARARADSHTSCTPDPLGAACVCARACASRVRVCVQVACGPLA
jgi:hypothetical protein